MVGAPLREWEAFAISDLYQEQRWESMGNRGSMLVWKDPWLFAMMVEDRQKDEPECIVQYHFEQITEVQFETYKEFGIPVVSVHTKEEWRQPYLVIE